MSIFSRRSAAAIVLAVLAALPLTGSLCAALCAAPERAASAAETARAPRCHESPSAGTEVLGAPGHDCGRHDPVAIRPASMNIGRADATVPFIGATGVRGAEASALALARNHSRAGPPSALPLFSTSRVLRI